MTDGIGFLREVKEGYAKDETMWPIHLSPTVHKFSEMGVPENESMMIYKGWNPTIEISSSSEFESFRDKNCGDDPRAYSNNSILFCTNDMDQIQGVVRTCLDYFMDKDYEAAMDGMIMALSPKKGRVLIQTNNVDNN